MDELQDYLLKEIKNENSMNFSYFLENYFLTIHSIWVKRKWFQIAENCCQKDLQNRVSSSILWLDYARGQFLEASLYINKIKNFINLSDPENNFLYFIFYPFPFKKEFKNASKKYSIDPDILYSIFRQQSLFYIEPDPKDLERISKKINVFNKKYKMNLTHVLLALKMGEKKFDNILEKNKQIKDDAYLLETLQDKTAAIFTQETLRNLYNIKWIYSKRGHQARWWKKIIPFF